MAADSFAKTIEDELTCPVCLDIFVEPKILPGCAHVCCEDCIRQMLGDSKSSLKCPECRKNVSITRESVATLKTNYRLRNLASKHSRDGDINGERAGVAICSKHADEKMHMYCESCNVMVCQLCLLESHNGSRHNVVGVKRRFKEQKVEMDALLKQTHGKIEKEKKSAREITLLMVALEASQTKEQRRIEEFTQRQMNAIAADSLALQGDLRKAGKKKREELQQQLTSIQKQIDETETDYHLVADTLNDAPVYTYATLHESFTYKLKRSILKIPKTRAVSRAVPKLILTRNSSNSVNGAIVLETPKSFVLYWLGFSALFIGALVYEMLRYFNYIDMSNEE